TLIMQVNIDANPVPCRKTKDDVEMAVKITIDADRVESADQVAAHCKCLVQQLGNTRTALDAALRKRDNLDVDKIAPGFAQPENRRQVFKAGEIVDIDMTADRSRAVLECERKQRTSTFFDVRREQATQRLLRLDAAQGRVFRPVRMPG